MDTERPQRPKRSWREWLDPFLAFTAILVSAISLWVAIGTEDANRQMVAAASWPLLQEYTGDTGKIITFSVLNGGVGPAKLKSFEVFWNGKPLHDSVSLLQACCDYRDAKPFPDIGATTQSISDVIIRAGEDHVYFSLPWRQDIANMWNTLDTARHRLQFRACYCSVFNECWIGTLKDLEPRRVNKCPTGQIEYAE